MNFSTGSHINHHRNGRISQNIDKNGTKLPPIASAARSGVSTPMIMRIAHLALLTAVQGSLGTVALAAWQPEVSVERC